MRRERALLQVVLMGLLLAGGAQAQIVSGRFLNWNELSPDLLPFGDGVHHVTGVWSLSDTLPPTSGYFYAGAYAASDSSVAYAPGCDASDVQDASSLSFVNSGFVGPVREHSLIVWRHQTTGHYGVLRVERMRESSSPGIGLLDGTWYFQTNGSGDFSRVLRRGDFDDDGHTDLVLRRTTSGRRMLWLLNGATQDRSPVWLSPDPVAGLRVAGVDDFDGDDHSDLVFQDEATGAVTFWMLDGAVRLGDPVPLTGGPARPAEWQIAAAGDFDGDGRGDLVWRNALTHGVEVWALNGTAYRATLVPSPDHAADGSWQVVAAQDYDGDGTRDLLWRNVSSGKTVQWLLDAQLHRVTGRFTSPAQAGDANWTVVASADFGAGPAGVGCTADLVWRNGVSGNLVLWYLDRDGRRTSGTFTSPAGPLVDPDGNPTPASGWTVEGPR